MYTFYVISFLYNWMLLLIQYELKFPEKKTAPVLNFSRADWLVRVSVIAGMFQVQSQIILGYL